jgi:hypothetical protein
MFVESRCGSLNVSKKNNCGERLYVPVLQILCVFNIALSNGLEKAKSRRPGMMSAGSILKVIKKYNVGGEAYDEAGQEIQAAPYRLCNALGLWSSLSENDGSDRNSVAGRNSCAVTPLSLHRQNPPASRHLASRTMAW